MRLGTIKCGSHPPSKQSRQITGARYVAEEQPRVQSRLPKNEIYSQSIAQCISRAAAQVIPGLAIH
jgi:hypothetical protein